MQPELSIMNWVLSDWANHKVGYARQHSIIKWKCYICHQALKAQVSYMMKWPKCPQSSLLINCLLSPSMHLWPHGEFVMISWQRKRKSRASFADGSAWHRYNLKVVQHHSPFPGHPWRAVVKGNPTSGHSFKQGTRLLTLTGRRDGWACNYILIHGLLPLVTQEQNFCFLSLWSYALLALRS